MNADGAAVKLLEAAAVGVFILLPRRCPQRFPFGGVEGQVLGEDRSLHRVLRAIAPAICVEVGAAADVPVAIAEVVGELESDRPLVAWVHPAPINATIAIAADKAAVRFVMNAFRSFEPGRTTPAARRPW